MKNIKNMTWEEENVIMEKMFKEAIKKTQNWLNDGDCSLLH